MDEAIQLIPKQHVKYRKMVVMCVQTGEVATLSEWAQKICDSYGIDSKKRVYARLHRAVKANAKSFGLDWKLTEQEGVKNV